MNEEAIVIQSWTKGPTFLKVVLAPERLMSGSWMLVQFPRNSSVLRRSCLGSFYLDSFKFEAIKQVVWLICAQVLFFFRFVGKVSIMLRCGVE